MKDPSAQMGQPLSRVLSPWMDGITKKLFMQPFTTVVATIAFLEVPYIGTPTQSI